MDDMLRIRIYTRLLLYLQNSILSESFTKKFARKIEYQMETLLRDYQRIF